MPFARASRATLTRLADPKQQAAEVAALTGAALASRDLGEARFWADRWRRLLPDSADAWLANACVAWLAGEDAAPALRKARGAAVGPTLPRLTDAARCALQTGAASEAALLLAEALPDPRFDDTALATDIARAAGLPGWIARTATGARLLLDDRSIPVLQQDGRGVALARQPDGSWRAQIAPLQIDMTVTAAARGTPLLGSPLRIEPTQRERRALLAARPTPKARARRGKADPDRPLTILVPVHGGGDVTRACIDAVLATKGDADELLVIDDAGPDPALLDWLRAHEAAGRLRLLCNERNLGFPATVNRGIDAAAGRDVLLLNSDTLPPPGDWLRRMRAAAYAAPDIGTVTALSNDATICSYPHAAKPNAMPDARRVAELDAAAARANRGVTVELPTGVGFCLYIRRDCLDQVGAFDEAAFGRGYGEENDFCLRARACGWRDVAAANVYVGHVGGHSFGASKQARIKRNLRSLNELHPGYDAAIRAWSAKDGLTDARAAIDAMLLVERSTRPSVLLVTIDLDGGVARHVEGRVRELEAQGLRPLVLRPRPLVATGALSIDEGNDRAYPNLIFALPADLENLVRLVAVTQPRWVEIHQPMNHDPSILTLAARLGVPYEVRVHDYAWICPRITLCDEPDRYCGEPPVEVCERCLFLNGSRVPGVRSVASLRADSAAFLAGARRVTAPSGDVVRRMARYAPAVTVERIDWEPPIVPAMPRPRQPRSDGTVRVALLGAIGDHKGYATLLGCARDAVRRDLPLSFTVVGFTKDDGPLLRTGRVRITGEFKEDEADTLLAAQQADLGLFASPWPETWSYTLSQALRASLPVVALDAGAVGERLRAAPVRSYLLPLGATPEIVNDALLALARVTQQTGAVLSTGM